MSGSLPWFRLYHRMIDDDKLRLLAFEDRWHFVALCCLKGSGLLDDKSNLRERKIAVKLGVQTRELDEISRRLFEVGLVDDAMNPIAWDELQFKSDGSSERVKRYREARKARGLKAQWQPTKELRNFIYSRDDFSCVYCGAIDDLTIDHKTPEMHGGNHDIENLQTACRACNAQKRDSTDLEYREKQRLNNIKRYGNVTVTTQDKDKDKDTELLSKDNKRGRAKIDCPLGVEKQVWADFTALRKAKRAPISKTVIDGIGREAEKAGWTLNEALTECVSRGWQGFKAEWIKDGKNGTTNRTSINGGYGQGKPIDGFTAAIRHAADRLSAGDPGGGFDGGGLPRIAGVGRNGRDDCDGDPGPDYTPF